VRKPLEVSHIGKTYSIQVNGIRTLSPALTLSRKALEHHFIISNSSNDCAMPPAELAVVPGGLHAIFRLAPLGPQVSALPHVVSFASSLLGVPPRWTLDAAFEFGL